MVTINLPAYTVRLTESQAYNLRRLASAETVLLTRAEFKSLAGKGLVTMNPGEMAKGMHVAYLTAHVRTVAALLAT